MQQAWPYSGGILGLPVRILLAHTSLNYTFQCESRVNVVALALEGANRDTSAMYMCVHNCSSPPGD